MPILHGIKAPKGDGVVLEVHLDIQKNKPSFRSWLERRGFENDPFLAFHPPEYKAHMTGRARVSRRKLKAFLVRVENLLDEVVKQAKGEGIDLYTEVELATSTTRFTAHDRVLYCGALQGFVFQRTGQHGGARADIHVEFDAETVPREVRRYLTERHFYWVSTPATDHFGAEDIATLQTHTYASARQVYEALVTHPLPFCTGIHLEQKLSMRATRDDLPMPEVIDVS